LDSNRLFVEDIYELVKERDGNWSLIPDGDYVRVWFEKELDSSKDITIYARSNYSNALVEVYEYNGSEVIAVFENVSEDKEYKIYLTELNGTQDIFDLRVVNGQVEFDWIVDPSLYPQNGTTIYECGEINDSGVYILNQSFSTTGSCLNITASNVKVDMAGFNISGDTNAADYGIFSTISWLSNVTVKNGYIYDFGRGIDFGNISNSVFDNLTVNFSGTAGGTVIGISITAGSVNVTISDNVVEISNAGSSSYGIDVFLTNSTIENNVVGPISGGSNSCFYVEAGLNNLLINNTASSCDNGFLIDSGATYNEFVNNTISSTNYGFSAGTNSNFTGNVVSSSEVGFRCAMHDGTNILTDNDFYSNTYGIEFEDSSNNTVIGGVINGSVKASLLLDDTGLGWMTGSQFINVSFNNSGSSYDFQAKGDDMNDTLFENTLVGNYSFTSGRVTFKDSVYGEIKFLEDVSGSGENLTDDIRIGNNSVFVNSSQTGLNRSANVTLYNIGDKGYSPQWIERDGVRCNSTTVPACGNYTSLIASTVIFNVTSWTNYSVGGNNLPIVTLVSPDASSTTTDRTPFFNWTGSDADGDDITYQFNLTLINGGSSSCVDSDANVQVMLTDSNYTPSGDLACFYGGGDSDYRNVYNWSVRANDTYGFGAWQSRLVNITALIAISMVSSSIDFGSMLPNASLNTTDASYDAFVVENQGNSLANISVRSDELWSTESNASKYFQFKADNYTGHEGAFYWGSSLVNWENMSTSDQVCVADLNYTALNRSEIDILLWVPPGELAAEKSFNITFTASLSEGI